MTVLRITRPLAAAAALLLASVPAWALYKVVGPNGEVTYTDRAPVDAKKAQALKAGGGSGNTPSTEGLPYQLQQVVGRYPVVLYASNSCSPCDMGRQYLSRRGIPFVEKTVGTKEDLRAYRALSGSDQFPLLKIGNQQLQGFAERDWDEYLTAAGYPAESVLPSGYKAPAPTPLATPAPAKEPPPAPAAPQPTPSASPTGNAPPGFRF